MSIKDKLHSLSLEELKWAVTEDWNLLCDAASIFGNEKKLESDKELLAAMIASFYGVDILSHVRFRQIFLSELPKSKIFSLAQRLTTNVLENSKDNIRNLANINWNSGSKLISVFSKELNFDTFYLPSKFQSMPTKEDVVPIGRAGKLFDYQEEVVEECEKFLLKGVKKFLVQLPTGSGKTRIVMELIKRRLNSVNLDSRARPIIWMAHSSELLEQAIESFKKLWMTDGFRTIRLIRLYGSTKLEDVDFSDTIIFASLQKLASMQKLRGNKRFEELTMDVDLAIVDEAHKITAPTYSKTATQILKHKGILIGVTATPGRSSTNDIENRSFASFFGGNLIKPSLGSLPVEELRNRGILAKLEKIDLDTNIDFSGELTNSNDDLTNASLEIVGRSKERNRLILDAVKKEVEQNRSTIIFACSLKHSELLCAGLAIMGLKASHISHKMSRNTRHNMINNFKSGAIDVIINYGILSTGFDAPNIRTVIITRPTTSVVLYSQMIGRGLRGPRVGGAEYCKLIDVKDNFNKLGSIHQINDYFKDYWN